MLLEQYYTIILYPKMTQTQLLIEGLLFNEHIMSGKDNDMSYLYTAGLTTQYVVQQALPNL